MRALLSVLVNTGTAADVVYTLPAAANQVFLEDDLFSGNGLLQLRSANSTFDTTVFANPTGSLTINRGNAGDTITVNPLNDFTAGLTIGSSTNPLASISFAATLKLAADKSVYANASGTINLSTFASKLILSGAGEVNLTTARNISLAPLSSITTVDGKITLSANQQATFTTGNFVGIDINSALVQATGTGEVTIDGRGGDDSTGSQFGVRVWAECLCGSTISGGQAGLVTVQGTGGASSGNSNRGVYVAPTSLITSSGANVLVSGQGGGSGTSGANDGVQIVSKEIAPPGGMGTIQVTAGGMGSVTVQGIGGAVSGNSNNGVYVSSNAVITSGGGNVQVTGQGGGTGASGQNNGVYITSKGKVTAGGMGSVTVQGIGGAGSGNSNRGVVVGSAGTITSGGGNVQVAGGEGAGSLSIALGASGGLVTSNGALSLIGNSMDLANAETIGTSVTGIVNLRPFTPGVGVNLSAFGKTVGGPLSLVLAQITGGTFNIGDSNCGPIVISADLTQPGKNLTLVTAKGVSGSGAISIGSTTPTTLTINQASDSTYSGMIGKGSSLDKNMAFTKLGGGTLTLTGANSYGGDTTIGGGTLALAGNFSNNISSSTTIDVQSSGILDTTGLSQSGGTLVLATGQTLKDAGIVTGKLQAASGSIVSPGDGSGILHTGETVFSLGSTLAIEINGPTVGAQYDQLAVTGNINLIGSPQLFLGSTLAAPATYSPAVGDQFTIINNTLATGLTSGTFNNLPEGGVIIVAGGAFSGTFQITYHGGDGNDVVLTAIDPVNPTPFGTSGDDNWLVKRNLTNLDVTLNNTAIWSTPFSSLTSLVFNGQAGNDTLTVDLSAGDAIPSGGITYDGGNPTTSPGDKLLITGGNQGTVTYNYSNTSSHDGSVVMSNYSTVTYTGVESIANSGAATDVILNLPTGPNTVTLRDDTTSGNALSRLVGSTFEQTDFINPINSLTINRGSASDTITVNTVPDFTSSLIVGSAGSEFSAVTFGGTLTLAANKNLSANAAGQILLTGLSHLAVSGSGAVTLTTAKNILIANPASIISVDGTITLSANQQFTPTSGQFVGVDIQGGVIKATGSGAVVLQSKGGDANISSQMGVRLESNARIQGGTGGVQVIGVGRGGGAGGGSLNFGILVEDGGQISALGSGNVTVQGIAGIGVGPIRGVIVSGNGSAITSGGGNVQVTGFGGGSANSVNNVGIRIDSQGEISATGSGTVTVQGTGGGGTGGSHGVEVTLNGTIKSNAGSVYITGQGGGLSTSTGNYGVYIYSAQVTAGGNGILSIQGRGGAGSGSNNIGVSVPLGGSSITSAGGDIDITGVEGGGSAGLGISAAGLTVAANGGAITLVANSIDLDGSSSISTTPNNSVSIRPFTSGVGLNLGLATNAVGGPLALTDLELDTFTAGTINIGDANTGSVTISRAIDRTGPTIVNLNSGGSISFAGGSINTYRGNLTLTTGSTGNVSPASAGVDVKVGAGALALSTDSRLSIAINGPIADTQYDQLNLNGHVDLSGVNLVLSGTYSPTVGEQFTIVKNDDIDPIIGEFNNLPDGKTFHIGTGTLIGDYVISYHGGDDNDVVITAISLTPSLAAIVDPAAINEDAIQQMVGLRGVSPGFGYSILSFTATSSNPALIPDPTLNYLGSGFTGSLSYKPLPDQFGTAVITLTVQDDGGTADGRIDTITRTFSVVVNPINDPPTFDNCVFPPQLDGGDDPPLFLQPPPCDVSGQDENPVTHGPASPRIIPDFVFNIQLGPPNESGTATFLVTYDNPGLFIVPPAIRSDLALTYTPKPNAHGSSMVTVVLDDGGDGNHTSPPVKFPIQITKPYPLHNTLNAFDVVGSFCPPNLGAICPPDGFVVATDAITVINYINARGSGPIPPNTPPGPPYPDVIPDNQIVAEDVIAIINWINAHPGQSEGESLDFSPQARSTAPAILNAGAVAASNSAAASDPAPVDLLSLLAADTAAVQLKRRRLV